MSEHHGPDRPRPGENEVSPNRTAGSTAVREPDGLGGGAHERDGAEAGKASTWAARVGWRRLLTMPALLVVILLLTWLWFRGADLDAVARNSLAGGNVWVRTRQHIEMTAISTFFVLVIAIPLGIALTRRKLRKAAPVAMIIANLGQAVPALGLLMLLVIWLGIGQRSAIIGMVIYAVLPVLANTIAGLHAIDPQLTEAARGIGMSPVGVLRRIELPLAVPLILAGVRTALVLNVGTATLATFGGGGGLGDLISDGITNQRMPILVLGSVLTVVLALFVDWLGSVAELLLRPRGLDSGKGN